VTKLITYSYILETLKALKVKDSVTFSTEESLAIKNKIQKLVNPSSAIPVDAIRTIIFTEKDGILTATRENK